MTTIRASAKGIRYRAPQAYEVEDAPETCIRRPEVAYPGG
jgi:hypothetical protein